MKAPRLTSRDRRALIIGAVALMPALLFQYGVRPYAAALSDARNRLEAQRGLLDRELALLDEAKLYPELAREAEGVIAAAASRLFDGPDRISTTAALVNYLGTFVQDHRVVLQRSETRSAEVDEDGIVSLQVSMRAIGDLEGLLGFLHALEDGAKLVRIEQLSIERTGRVSLSGASDEEVLSLFAIVTGYALEEPEGPNGETQVISLGGSF